MVLMVRVQINEFLELCGEFLKVIHVHVQALKALHVIAVKLLLTYQIMAGKVYTNKQQATWHTSLAPHHSTTVTSQALQHSTTPQAQHHSTTPQTQHHNTTPRHSTIALLHRHSTIALLHRHMSRNCGH